MRKAEFLKRLEKARAAVAQEIKGNGSDGSKYARGLAGEGFASGYKTALDDVEAMLTHGSSHKGNQ
jgi:hypothetical protein